VEGLEPGDASSRDLPMRKIQPSGGLPFVGHVQLRPRPRLTEARMGIRWFALLLAISRGTMPAVGIPCRKNRNCPLMVQLLHRTTSKQGIVLDVGSNGGYEMTIALRHGRQVIRVGCLASVYRELRSASHSEKNPNAILPHESASNSTRMAELILASDSSSQCRKRKKWVKVPRSTLCQSL